MAPYPGIAPLAKGTVPGAPKVSRQDTSSFAHLVLILVQSLDDVPAADYRRIFPWFSPDNITQNLALAKMVKTLANRKGCTPGQLAINWVRCLSRREGMPTIIPIPGASTAERARENGVVVDLNDDDMDAI